jgi:hypothetical protein
MHDQRRRGDTRQGVAHIGLAHDLDDCAGHAGGCGAVARHVPPRAERVVTGHAGRDDAEDVDTLVDGVRLHCDGPVGVGVGDFEPHRVVGRMQGAGRPVDDHQAADPLGIVGRQDESGHRGEPGGEHRSPARSRSHPGPRWRLWPRTSARSRPATEPVTTCRPRAGRAGSPELKDASLPVESGTSTARRRPCRSGWTGPAAPARRVGPSPNDLVGDVDLAAAGVASPRKLRHCYRLVQRADMMLRSSGRPACNGRAVTGMQVPGSDGGITGCR